MENSWDLLQPQHVGGNHCAVVERSCAGNLWAGAESRTGSATPAHFYPCSFQPVMLLCSVVVGHLCALIQHKVRNSAVLRAGKEGYSGMELLSTHGLLDLLFCTWDKPLPSNWQIPAFLSSA